MCGFAPARRSDSTHAADAALPSVDPAASINAVGPRRSVSLGAVHAALISYSPGEFRRQSTTETCPWNAANIRAVAPWRVFAPLFAPCLSNRSTQSA
eukprot:scaffold20337_cov30-Tisochrysis_lutea.AAC.2